MQKKSGSLTESKNTQQLKSYNVLLIGESCKDIYHYGLCERISPEAPVPIFDFKNEEIKIGMAGNVYSNLKSFNINVDFITNDSSKIIRRRFVDIKSKHVLLREDENHSLDKQQFKIKKPYDAILISDYNRGLMSDNDISNILKSFDGPIFVDSKRKNLSVFENCIIKINNKERENITSVPNSCKIITTLGEGGAEWNDVIYPAPQIEVFDVTGAGDVFFASLCYFYLTLNNIEESIKKSIVLASRSVQHLGIYKITDIDIDEVK
jgi:bifunctional ADP-heptose synthase (sugar kinase/adenylyltransferase)